MWNSLRALAGYFAFAVLTLAWLPCMALLLLVTLPFDRHRTLAGRGLRVVATLVGRSYPRWQMSVEGAHHRPAGPFVAIANHESILDVLLLPRLPWEMKWVAKASLFKLPVIGWMLRMAGDMPLVRGDAESGAEVMERARQYLAGGMPVMFFPEGTRSRTDELRPFKLGAFKLAIEFGCPILPIAVFGTRGGMPVGSPWVRPTRAVARVLAPEATHGLSLPDAPALADQLRERITQARAALAIELATP